MKISSILLAMIFIVSIANAQIEFEAPDYNQIEKITQDSASDFYYPELFKRYENLDITLTLKEMRALYYGYLFRSDYSPYVNSNKPNPLISKSNKSDEELHQLIEAQKKVLKEYPFNLRDMNIIHLCYKDLGDNEKAKLWFERLKLVIDAILSSGDGLSVETAIHVTSISHEYDIINILGLQFGGSQALVSGCDQLSIQENDYGIDHLYFNVSMMLAKQNELFE